MALTSYQFRGQPYWLGFVFAGQAFTVSYREKLSAGKSLNIQISTGADTIMHLASRKIVSQNEQLGIRLIKSPHFVPGTNQIPAVNLDDRSKIRAVTSFYAGATNISGGTVMEESMIPRLAFTQGGEPVESLLFERILQYDTNYILSVTNEGCCPASVLVSIAFYESGN